MVASNYRLVPPNCVIIPIEALIGIAKLVDAVLTLEGRVAALDAQKAALITSLAKVTEQFVEGSKL